MRKDFEFKARNSFKESFIAKITVDSESSFSLISEEFFNKLRPRVVAEFPDLDPNAGQVFSPPKKVRFELLVLNKVIPVHALVFPILSRDIVIGQDRLCCLRIAFEQAGLAYLLDSNITVIVL